MNIEEYSKILGEIHFIIILEPEYVNEFKEKIIKAINMAGLKAYIRADGYAFMQNEIVGSLGLPHIRLGIVEDKIMMWIRDPYRLDKDLIEKVGFSVDEYVMQLLDATRILLEVFKSYSEKAKAIHVEYPSLDYKF